MKVIFNGAETCLMSEEFKLPTAFLPGIPVLNDPASP
jgi:hypothetical protein